MKRICLGCCEDVSIGSINENYNGMAIHYGYDWYCGPVVEVQESVFEATLNKVKSDRVANDYYADIAAEHCLHADAEDSADLQAVFNA